MLFYFLAPLPTLLARRYNADSSGSSSALEFAIFLTMGIVISSFALPIVLARAPDLDPVVSLFRRCMYNISWRDEYILCFISTCSSCPVWVRPIAWTRLSCPVLHQHPPSFAGQASGDFPGFVWGDNVM